VAPDGLSATFRLRPEARFHNGDPVLAADVKHTFDILMGPFTSPAYKTLLEDVAACEALDARTVRFRFRKPNRELPLTVGGLPVFSRAWGAGKPFDKVVTDVPIGSGAYRIGPVRFGKDITYLRDKDYWARDLNVKRGMDNFDRVTVKIYADNTARLEALKAGEFDAMRFFSAGDWARRLTGRKFESGELVKGEFRHRLPSGFQSYVLNTRRPPLDDRRVREALGLAMDYEWLNRQMFYGSYQRVNGMFGNTDCAATGLPSPQELALLEPFRASLPPDVFGPMTAPPRTDARDQEAGGPSTLRGNLRRARDLLREAGWTVRDGALRNAKGEPMVLESLMAGEGASRVENAWARNLQKLGIALRMRPTDFALYQQRLQKFDFDIVTINYAGTHNPGQEYADILGSKAARTEDSGNIAGVSSPAVDALVARMVGAASRAEQLPACRALDRVVAHGHYFVPQWMAPTHRMVYNAWRLQMPAGGMPPYAAQPETWAIETWWARPQAPAR